MKRINIFLIGIAMISMVLVNCKKKVKDPVAGFTLSSKNVMEGTTITVTNSSTNAVSYTWAITNLAWSSTSSAPSILMDTAGIYTLELTAKNEDGKTSIFKDTIRVNVDMVWRLSNNNKKKWRIKSIIYSGTEQLTANCQKDDEFTVTKGATASLDSFLISEGTDKCPSGTYIFEMPSRGIWNYNKSKNTFSFSLYAFGSPVQLDLVINSLTRKYLKGKDATNGVDIVFYIP